MAKTSTKGCKIFFAGRNSCPPLSAIVRAARRNPDFKLFSSNAHIEPHAILAPNMTTAKAWLKESAIDHRYVQVWRWGDGLESW